MALRVNQVTRVRCEPGWRLDQGWSNRLPDQDIWYVFDGRGTMQLRRQHVELYPGVCIWARPGGLYLGEQDPRDRLGVLSVHFDGPPPPRDEVFEIGDVGYSERLLNRVVDAKLAGYDAVAAAVLAALTTDLRSGACVRRHDLAGTARHHQDTVQGVVVRIRETPGETPEIAELARQAGYSTDHFTRVFREQTGQTPRDFIIDARIARARQLLTESSLSIGQVAEVLGYDSLFYFSRQFKQRVGVSPSAYRGD